MNKQEFRRLARLGAEARLRDLEREIATIHGTFPDLRRRRSVEAGNPYTTDVERAVAGVPSAISGAVTRRRPKLSAEARKRIGEAQKKRWADWKAQKSAAETAAKASAPKPAASSRKKK